MQEHQKLCINYHECAGLLKKLFNNSINEPNKYDTYCKFSNSYIAVFIMQKDGSARLDFIKNIEYKFIELLSVDFLNSPEDMVRKYISFKYSSLKSKITLLQDRIHNISNIVKIKNPSLLLQIQKTPAKLKNNSSVAFQKNKNTSNKF